MKHTMQGKPRFAPRDHAVAAMRFRKSGAHTKTIKAIRKSEKQAFRKEIRERHDRDLRDLFPGASGHG